MSRNVALARTRGWISSGRGSAGAVDGERSMKLFGLRIVIRRYAFYSGYIEG